MGKLKSKFAKKREFFDFAEVQSGLLRWSGGLEPGEEENEVVAGQVKHRHQWPRHAPALPQPPHLYTVKHLALNGVLLFDQRKPIPSSMVNCPRDQI